MTIKENLMERKIGERYFLNSSDNGNCVYIMNQYSVNSYVID